MSAYLRRELAEVKSERDRLREALKQIVDADNKHYSYDVTIAIARAALAGR